MKKPLIYMLVCIIICIPIFSHAVDYSSLTDDELLAEIEKIQAELIKRNVNRDSESQKKIDSTPFKKIGNIVSFGSYEQDTDEDNGKEMIEWIVLDTKGEKSLLISRYGLDAMAFNPFTEKDITWEDSMIRKWLNELFFDMAFTEKEKNAILLSYVSNADIQGYMYYNATSSNDTEDHLFLLSYHEAYDLYFANNISRMCAPTDYAIEHNAWHGYEPYQNLDNKEAGMWWLRSPGEYHNSAMNVDYDGSRAELDYDRIYSMIRPAMWIDLKSSLFN